MFTGALRSVADYTAATRISAHRAPRRIAADPARRCIRGSRAERVVAPGSVRAVSRSRVVAVLALGAALLLSGCTSSDDSPAPSAGPTRASTAPTPAPDGPRYVALGDSFTAGPGIVPIEKESGLCIRSLKNYPRLVAASVDATTFTDVSCSGATTDDVLESGLNPAQLDAVSPDTGLVTIGIGGNDSGLFAALSRACTTDSTSCSTYLRDTLPSVLSSTSARVVSTLRAVEDKAPDADVVLVGYLRIAPESGTCTELGGSAFDAAGVAEGERSLDATLAAAARTAGATFVSMSAASKGHDACAGDDAWTNGLQPAEDDGITLHPRESGMKAVATQVEKAVAAL
ncbi:MAG: SGNH/GDSL hydrolase family protein [Actinomycetales bacterium]|nr:MAG: SGNH/GDSL hydrolase family protein [Actinomycetales bacterium]